MKINCIFFLNTFPTVFRYSELKMNVKRKRSKIVQIGRTFYWILSLPNREWECDFSFFESICCQAITLHITNLAVIYWKSSSAVRVKPTCDKWTTKKAPAMNYGQWECFFFYLSPSRARFFITSASTSSWNVHFLCNRNSHGHWCEFQSFKDILRSKEQFPMKWR